MPDSQCVLGEARTAWAYTRASVAEEAENIAADEFGFRPAPESRSVAELLRHIIESGLMMSGELARENGDFTRQSFDEHIREYAGEVAGVNGKDELLRLLRESHADGDRRIGDRGELFMLQLIRQFDGERATRLSWMYHGISHEEYHRGQLALYARLLGRVPALTQQLRGEK